MLKSKEKKWLKQTKAAIKRDIAIAKSHLAEGNISTDQAHKHLADRYGDGYHDNLRAIEKTLRRDTVEKAAIGAVLAVLLIPALFLGSGVTGFIAKAVDKPVDFSIEQTFYEPLIFITRIDEKVTSLRATGVYEGTGAVKIYHIDGSGTQRLIFSHVPEEVPAGAVLLQDGELGIAQQPNRRITFTQQCEQTCQLDSEGPHQLRIDINGGELDLSSLSYTKRVILEEAEPNEDGIKEELLPPKEQPPQQIAVPEPVEPEPIEEAPIEEVPEEPEPVEEPIEEIPTEEEAAEEIPEEEPIEEETHLRGKQSIKCHQDADCPIGHCGTNMYEGKEVKGVCVAEHTCIGPDKLVYDPGMTYGDNVCYGSEQGGSVWISEEGRWQVQRKQANILAVIDAYGSMAITGTPTWETTASTDGWQLSKEDQPIISISRVTGDLYAQGELYTRATLDEIEGEQIANPSGNVVAVMDPSGNVYLAGDFANNVLLV